MVNITIGNIIEYVHILILESALSTFDKKYPTIIKIVKDVVAGVKKDVMISIVVIVVSYLKRLIIILLMYKKVRNKDREVHQK